MPAESLFIMAETKASLESYDLRRKEEMKDHILTKTLFLPESPDY